MLKKIVFAAALAIASLVSFNRATTSLTVPASVNANDKPPCDLFGNDC
jgi:hypothetical protein